MSEPVDTYATYVMRKMRRERDEAKEQLRQCQTRLSLVAEQRDEVRDENATLRESLNKLDQTVGRYEDETHVAFDKLVSEAEKDGIVGLRHLIAQREIAQRELVQRLDVSEARNLRLQMSESKVLGLQSDVKELQKVRDEAFGVIREQRERIKNLILDKDRLANTLQTKEHERAVALNQRNEAVELQKSFHAEAERLRRRLVLLADDMAGQFRQLRALAACRRRRPMPNDRAPERKK